MSDTITIHQNEPQYSGIATEWRPPDGDHNYQGTGTSSGIDGPTIWSPCIVCQATRDDPVHGFAWRTCSYCGSIHPEDLLAITENIPKTRTFEVRPGETMEVRNIEWADWKYGYPHKLYIDLPKNDRAKFYSRHFVDHRGLIGPFNERLDHLGIRFSFHPNKGLGWVRNVTEHPAPEGDL